MDKAYIFLLAGTMFGVGMACGEALQKHRDASVALVEMTNETWKDSASAREGECSFLDAATGRPFKTWKVRADGNCYSEDAR